MIKVFNMSNNNENYAIVIELSGEMLDNAKKAQSLMSNNYGVEFISKTSPCPHITLESGLNINDLDIFTKAIKKSSLKLKTFSLCAQGLGVFLAETPVIHIRWLNNNSLLKLKSNIADLVNNFLLTGVITKYSNDLNWAPKSTLAFSDTTNEGLSELVKLINNIDFNKCIFVSNISIYKYSLGSDETNIATFPFKN